VIINQNIYPLYDEFYTVGYDKTVCQMSTPFAIVH